MNQQNRDSVKKIQGKEINIRNGSQSIQQRQDHGIDNNQENDNELNQNLSMFADMENNELNNSLFPSRQSNLPLYWKYGHKFDIFNFQPVPKSTVVSSSRSQIASIVAILLMLSFIGYTVYDFFNDNVPRLNQYKTPIDYNQEFKAQEFAFGFYEMDTSSNLVEDPSVFTYYLEQYIYSNKPADVGHEELSKQVDVEYCTPEWAPIKIKMLCPKQQMYMQGMIGKGDYLKYPRLKILACNDNNAEGIKCNKEKAISQFPKGRLFVFIKQDEKINFATKDVTPESGIFYYYFIVPNLFDRAETVVGVKQITKLPNYATTFEQSTYKYQAVTNNNLYVSDVSYFFKESKNLLTHGGTGPQTNMIKDKKFNLKDALNQKSEQRNFQQMNVLRAEKVDPTKTQPYFAWWMSIDPSQNNIYVNYKTSANMISLWGGLWGVLQAGFTFIYMTYNAKMFYQNNKEWDRFDNVIRVHRPSVFQSKIKRNNLSENEEITQQHNKNDESILNSTLNDQSFADESRKYGVN